MRHPYHAPSRRIPNFHDKVKQTNRLPLTHKKGNQNTVGNESLPHNTCNRNEGAYVYEQRSRREYVETIRERYHRSFKREKRLILDEFCRVCGYNWKYAIRLLGFSPVSKPKGAHPRRAGRPKQYTDPAIRTFLKSLSRRDEPGMFETHEGCHPSLASLL